MTTVTREQLEALSASKLNAIIELVQPSKVEGWNKAAMVDSLLEYGNPDKLAKAYALMSSGLEALDKGSELKTDPSPATASVDAAISSLVEKVFENRLEAIEEKLESTLQPTVKHIVVRDKIEVDLGDEILPEQFPWVLSLAAQRLNILLVGPAGSGKTHMAATVAKALGLRFGSISVTMGMSKSDLLGYLLPIGEGGKFEYVPSTFVDIYENGGVFLLDEIDNADANTLGILNQALANGSFYLPQRVGNHEVRKHPDFVCIAAANTFGTGADAMYVGRNQLDAATLDRFTAGRVLVNYSKAVEEALVDAEILAWAREVRKKIDELNLRRILSTRVLIDFTRLKKAEGVSLNDIKKVYFQDWSPQDRAKVQA